jgi:hypothetical protein
MSKSQVQTRRVVCDLHHKKNSKKSYPQGEDSYTQGDLCKCEVNHISHMSDFALNVQVHLSDPSVILLYIEG